MVYFPNQRAEEKFLREYDSREKSFRELDYQLLAGTRGGYFTQREAFDYNSGGRAYKRNEIKGLPYGGDNGGGNIFAGMVSKPITV